MRKLSLVLALVVGLFGFSSTANAGIVDITIYTTAANGFNAGDVTLRNNAGLNLYAIALNLGGMSAGSIAIVGNAGIDAGASFGFPFGPDIVAQFNVPFSPANSWIDSNNVEVLIATTTGFGALTQIGCNGCATNFGGAAFTDLDGITSTADTTDVSGSVMYFIVPEPAALALLGLGLAGLAFVRRSAA